MTFGFIITRHVNSETTNCYWNECVRCIRKLYSQNLIVIIDDNSDQTFVKADFEYKKVEYVKSEYIQRGELLPYYYFFKNHYFDNAVIIHDSVFIKKKINFDYLQQLNVKVMPLWHFEKEKRENLHNSLRIVNNLKNNNEIINHLSRDVQYENLGMNTKIWHGCFGVQSFINYNFLSTLQNKYNLFNLLDVVRCRADRCCLERIMGVLFFIEYPQLSKQHSILGDIYVYTKWGYTYKQHCENTQNKIMNRLPVIKVWSGR